MTGKNEVIARRKTYDGVGVELWSDGVVTGRLGYELPGVPLSRPRTVEAQDLALRAGWLFLGEVEIHGVDELGLLYQASKWAAERDGLPGTVRRRLRELTTPKVTPRWTVISADRDGRPTERYWQVPRLLVPSTAVWDYVSVGASLGRYEIYRAVPGTKQETYAPSGIKFSTLAEVSAFLLGEHEANLKD